MAGANSDVFVAAGGVFAYLKMNISADKLVFGQPWYGYDYKCTQPLSPDGGHCIIEEVPFRGVNCSDAAGIQVPYGEIVDTIQPTGEQIWDPHSG